MGASLKSFIITQAFIGNRLEIDRNDHNVFNDVGEFLLTATDDNGAKRFVTITPTKNITKPGELIGLLNGVDKEAIILLIEHFNNSYRHEVSKRLAIQLISSTKSGNSETYNDNDDNWNVEMVRRYFKFLKSNHRSKGILREMGGTLKNVGASFFSFLM